MHSMPYYTYGSTANFLVLGPTVLICISKERHCNENLCGIGNFIIEQVINSYGDFSEGQLNVNVDW